IAAAYGTRVSTLVALNGLDSAHRIRAGQRLRLPAAGPAPAVVAAETTAPAAEPPPIASEPPAVATAEATAGVEEDIALAAAEEPAEAPAEPALPGELSDDLGSTLMGALRSGLLSDPSDYSVAADGTIEVHPLETLGHYADRLRIRTRRLRDINGFAFGRPGEVGQRIQLDRSRRDVDVCQHRGPAHHTARQD